MGSNSSGDNAGRARTLKLQDYLPYRLSVAANAVSQRISQAYAKEFGLRIAQWRLLAVLAEEGALTQRVLCERTVMDKVTVARAARALLKRGFVRRLPNRADRRSHRLRLTVQGAQLYRRIVPLALEYEAQIVAGLSRTAVQQIKAWLQQLQEQAGGR